MFKLPFTIRFFFAWYDGWVGYYWNVSKRTLYICLLPWCAISFQWKVRNDLHCYKGSDSCFRNFKPQFTTTKRPAAVGGCQPSGRPAPRFPKLWIPDDVPRVWPPEGAHPALEMVPSPMPTSTAIEDTPEEGDE